MSSTALAQCMQQEFLISHTNSLLSGMLGIYKFLSVEAVEECFDIFVHKLKDKMWEGWFLRYGLQSWCTNWGICWNNLEICIRCHIQESVKQQTTKCGWVAQTGPNIVGQHLHINFIYSMQLASCHRKRVIPLLSGYRLYTSNPLMIKEPKHT